MAKGDILQSVNNGLPASATTTSVTFTSINEGDIIVLFCSARAGSNTVSTAPSGYTLMASTTSTGWPIAHCYAKVAGASESVSPSITWASTDQLGMAGVRFEGSFSALTDLSVQAVDEDGSVTSTNVPASAMSSARNGVAVAYIHTYHDATGTHAFDNSFINAVVVAPGSTAIAYANKVITHPDTDIQTLVSWTGENASADGFMALLQPSAAAGSILKQIMQHTG